MGLNKRLYVEYDTKIIAKNMNEIQDCIIANERKIQEIIDKTVGIQNTLGINNELFNDVLSHVIEGDDTTENNHLEGFGNKVIKAHKNYNNEGNHLEGYSHIAGGYCGYLENSLNRVYETNAHAGGIYSIASGAGTFSQGRGVISMGLGSAALGQSLFTDGSTTVLGLDGEETEIDWTTHANETEQQRSKRIADRIEKLYLGTELKSDGTPNTSVQRKFLASLGTGTIVGGINCFGRGTASLVHGLGCYTLSSYCFSGGYSAKIGKNSDDCFAFGDNLIIEDNVKDAVLFGTLNTLRAPYSFISGYQNNNGLLAQYSFLLGTNSYINAPNSYGFGDHLSIGTKGQTVFGKYNDNESTALFAIANGTESKRKNIFEIYSDRNVFQNKNVFYDDIAFGKTLKSINCGNNSYNTIVMGLDCSNNAIANNSFTGGENCQSQAKNTFTFGLKCYAAAENSAAIGEGIVVGTKDQVAVGKYNNNESKALFAVGGGKQEARKNSFEVFEDYVNINGNKFDGNIPIASDYTPGIIRLYDSIYGLNTDGTVTQRTLSQTLRSLQRSPDISFEYINNNVFLNDNTQYYVINKDSTELILIGVPWSAGAFCRFCFRSGATATKLIITPDEDYTLIWAGDHCETGTFVPKTNMIYCVETLGMGAINIDDPNKRFAVANVKAYPYTVN